MYFAGKKKRGEGGWGGGGLEKKDILLSLKPELFQGMTDIFMQHFLEM